MDDCEAILGATFVVETNPSPEVVSGRSASCEVTLSHFGLAYPNAKHRSEIIPDEEVNGNNATDKHGEAPHPPSATRIS